MSDDETEGSMGPLGMERTSKQQQKFAAVGVADQRVVVGGSEPPAGVRDARVRGVNAEYFAHRRGVAEDEDRRRRDGRARHR